MFDIVALGELLIDFTENGISKYGMRQFEQNPGGAPCNMLCSATKLGCKTAFIGKVGNDMHGKFLKSTLDAVGIDTTGLVLDDEVFTTLAFVALSNDGEREFSFARKPGADACLESSELNMALLQECRAFHFGSISLSKEPARSATMEALLTAKRNGAIITYDPNYRDKLWENEELAKEEMRKPLSLVDVVKVADGEVELLTGETELTRAVEFLHKKGIRCVAVTLGADGSFISLKDKGNIVVPGAPDLAVVDKTGAGDAFFGAFVAELLQSEVDLDQITLSDAAGFAQVANATATLCISKRGGIPAMPSRIEVEAFMKKCGTFYSA